jgi:TonB family protein
MKKKNDKSRLSDFTRYIRGEMTKREENAIQRELQRDPFAAEAADGLAQISPDEAMDDMKILERRLKTRISGRERVMYYRIAASIAVLMIISSVFVIIDRNKPAGELSKKAAIQTPVEVPESEAIKEQPEKNKNEAQVGAGAEKPKNIPLQTAEEPSRITAEERVAIKAPVPKASLKKAALAEVRGTVISSEDNLPVPGAVISLKGTDKRVLTDTEGKFSIPLADTTPAVLVADFIGMERQEFRAKEDTDMKISLTPTAMALSEVVVVGYEKSLKGKEAGAAEKAEYEEPEYISAQPVTGNYGFDKYIEENIKNPASLPSGQRAVVVLSFTVKSTGVIDSIKVLRSPGQEFSDEAIRLIKEGPAWKPAEDNDQTIDDEVRIRIVFK